jgi:hypothetical protein
MKKRRLIIALLISCVLLCCAAQAVTLRITVADEKTDNAISGASIYIDGTYVGSTSSSGTYSYVHSGYDDLYLKVVKTGYQNWVDYVDDDATRVEVDMSRADETLTFELYDAGTLKPISGAVVKVEGDDYSDSEVTGSDGSAKFSVESDESYSVEVRASGYYELSKTVEMESSDRVVQYWLYSNDLMAFQVRDSDTSAVIKGAEVYIDNSLAGVTDAEGRLQIHLDRAKRYSIKVTAAGYQAYQENRYFETDDVLLQAPLSKSTYAVSLTVFNETKNPVEGAEVYLNGTLQGKTSQYGRFSFSSLHAGTYLITVKAYGYGDWSETHQITGTGEDIVAELNSNRATVTIRAQSSDQKAVTDAVVVIDGQVVGVTDSLGCFKTALATNKVYAVAAARDGYRNISVNAEIPLGTTEFTVPLVMEQDFNVWVLVAGVGVVAVLLLAVVAIVRHRRAGRNQGRSPGRDSL